MRVALCLCGVVGNVYIDKKEYSYHSDVDYRIGLEHYRNHLFSEQYDVDVFVHSWSTQHKEGISKDYQPKLSLFEEQIDFGLETKRLNFTKSRWYSTKRVVELKRQYEEANDFEYDWVLLSRFDLCLLKDLDFSMYNRDTFYAPHDCYDPKKSYESPMFLDYWFFSNSKNMDKFSILYDKWDEYGIYNAHKESFWHAYQLKLNIDYTFMEHKDHELTRALYDNCEHNQGEFKGLDSLVKFEEYPKHRF